MPIIATGSQTIIDLSDGKSLSVYLGTNQPRTQILDVNAGTYSPDWSTTTGKLVITPVVYANQTAIELTDKALAITWKRKEGSASEAALGSGETVSGNILTVSANKIGSTGAIDLPGLCDLHRPGHGATHQCGIGDQLCPGADRAEREERLDSRRAGIQIYGCGRGVPGADCADGQPAERDHGQVAIQKQ